MNNFLLIKKAALICLAAFFILNTNFAKTKISDSAWVEIGNGINYLEIDSNSTKIFLGFAGWTVKQNWSNSWVSALANYYLAEKGFGKYYAIKGPDDVLFESKNDIEIDSLLKILNQNLEKIDEIVISAHSSGSFVSNYFLNKFLFNKENKIPKITYFNLDGGIGEGETYLDKLASKKIHKNISVSVYDKQTNTYSSNIEAMKEFSKIYDNSDFLLIELESTNCNQNAIWCLHDRLIKTIPKNPTFYDLENDYNNFSDENPPTIEYLKIYFR